MTWSTQPGKSRGFPPAQRLRILARDPICRCTGCPRCTPNGCTTRSTEADHIGDRNDMRITNGRGLCTPCHAWRTAQQGNAAPRARAKREPEKHPGLR